MRIAVDPLYELVRQRGLVEQIARLRNNLEIAQRQLPNAVYSIEVCNADVIEAERELVRRRQFAGEAVARHQHLMASIDAMTVQIERLEEAEADEAKKDVRRVAEAELARAQQQVTELTTALQQQQEAS